MNNNQILEFESIINKLENYTFTSKAKEKAKKLIPILSETELRAKLRETTEARIILDEIGTPPMSTMDGISELLMVAEKGGMLLASQLEYIETCFTAISRLKDFLNRCKRLENGLAYYSDNLFSFDELRKEIQNKIRNGLVDDYASNTLKDIRRNITSLEDKIKQKAEGMLRNNSEVYSDTFIVTRNGHICLPVKKDYKFRVNGSVIDKSSTGATLFIEPNEIAKLNEELQLIKLDEENEVIRILYELTGLLADVAPIFQSNLELIEKLDFIFAKGKLSVELKAREPKINTERHIKIKKGRHPLLKVEECVPLDFQIGNGINGVIITGPNTGGKTVAVKTVGLLSIMAQSGLHIPCEDANICMNNQVLCDIGDGQNITENLSTFSSHIVNVLDILKKVNNESLVILDELGSGTDPAEGMGIAIAILEQLKISDCLFLATTHYPEVKVYAEKEVGIVNAMMEFDRDTLKPLYRLEIGKAGESCALYIARHLGMPDDMLKRAGIEAYGEKASELLNDLELDWVNNRESNKENNKESNKDNNKENNKESNKENKNESNQESNKGNNKESNKKNNIVNNNNNKSIIKEYVPKIQKKIEPKNVSRRAERFQIGDSVLVYPEKKIGIVASKANAKGELLVQLKKQKILVNHKRLQLQVTASELYPEDYDFSIVFDTVANRKARHKMSKGYQPGLEIKIEE